MNCISISFPLDVAKFAGLVKFHKMQNFHISGIATMENQCMDIYVSV